MNEFTTAEVRALAKELASREPDPILSLAKNVLQACADGRVFPDDRVRDEFTKHLEAP